MMRDDWRDVPMPPGVAALPRTPGGIPITYTVAWTSERDVRLAPEPLIDGSPLAVFSDGRQCEGRPKLAIVDTARQRRVALKGLCQVCARKLPGRRLPPWRQHPRWLADLRKDGQTIQHGLRELPLVIDSWTCEPCLTYALQVCPGLLRRDWRPGADGALSLLRVRAAELVLTMERPDSIPAEELPSGAVGLVKVMPTAFDVVAPDEFLAERGVERRSVA